MTRPHALRALIASVEAGTVPRTALVYEIVDRHGIACGDREGLVAAARKEMEAHNA